VSKARLTRMFTTGDPGGGVLEKGAACTRCCGDMSGVAWLLAIWVWWPIPGTAIEHSVRCSSELVPFREEATPGGLSRTLINQAVAGL